MTEFSGDSALNPLMSKEADYGVLNDLARNTANTRNIEQHRDGMMRMGLFYLLPPLKMICFNQTGHFNNRI
ncbi:hypothetical protein AB7W30_21225 [Providencia manganoxydans]|uniref:hypothetical protein n=1 Tax=Providencia manganoxydans TaxID=2923283 RepID=UPI0032DBA7A3